MKRSGFSDQGQLRFKKRAQVQEEPRSSKVKLEKGGGSQNIKATCFTCGNRHYGKCLKGTGSFFGCGKEGHKVRYCSTSASRGREGKQVAPNVLKNDAPNKKRVYALRTKGSKPDEDEE